MSRIVQADGDMMEVSGAFAVAAKNLQTVEALTPLPTLEGYTGILWRGGWAAIDGGAARLAVLDAEHGDAELRARRAKDELANSGRPPQFQPIPGGADLSGCDVLLEARAAELEVEGRILMRLIHRAAIRDAAEFEAILVAVAEAARAHTLFEVVVAMMETDCPRLVEANARLRKAARARARARANVAAEVRARVAEILANPGATPAVTGAVREEIIAIANRCASFSKELTVISGLADVSEGACTIA